VTAMNTLETLDDVIAALQDARDLLGGSAAVRIAHNNRWPLRLSVAAVTVQSDPDADSPDDPADIADRRYCWIATGVLPGTNESPYAPRWAWEE
jgi:hypothetical protein